MRRVTPMKIPFTSVLLDDSSVSTPMVAANVAAAAREPGENPSALNIAGLRLVPVGRELAAYLGRGSERGLLVIDVPEWAASALRPGDVVLSVDGSRVRANDRSDEVTVALPRLREAQLDILRDRVHHSVTLPARR